MIRAGLLAMILAGGPMLALAADPSEAPAAAAQTCECKACDEPVCCKAPTGFAPLDQKCAERCRVAKWTSDDGKPCERKSNCCQ